jgi:hypothetical protein
VDAKSGILEYERVSASVCVMDTLDTRFKRIADAIRALDEPERSDVLGALEKRLFDTETLLNPEQLVELDRRLAGPMEMASRDEVEAVFARHSIKR